MNKKFLNKVLEQLVNETIMDFTAGRIYAPAFSLHLPLSSSFPLPLTANQTPSPPHSFSQHCKNLYALNEEEIDYVWNEYRNIINDKINEQEVSK